MPLLPVKLPPGIVRNGTPYETPGSWYDCDGVRWQSGNMVPVGGWNKLTPSNAPLDSPPRVFEVWKNNASQRMVIVGTDNKLYVDSSGAYVDITPAGFTGPGSVLPTGGFGTGSFSTGTFGTARSAPSPIFSPYGYWTVSTWGEDLIFTCNADGRLFYYTQSTPLVPPTPIGPAFTGPAQAVVTGSIATTVLTVTAITPQATFTATAAGTTLTVSAVASGTIAPGQRIISGTGITGTPTILSQLSGTIGGIGTYQLSATETVASGVTMTSAVPLAVGQKVTGAGITQPGTYAAFTILSFGTGTGGTGTYNLSASPGTIASETITTFAPTTAGAVNGCNAVIVTPERHVMAIGFNGQPRSIGWSSSEDPTDWNFSSLTNTAGSLPLISRTPLLSAVLVREGTLVFSYTDVFLIRYVNLPSIYGGNAPISDTELMSPASIATANGSAAWPTQRMFQQYIGGSVAPLPCPLFNDVFGTDGNGDPSVRIDPTWGAFRIHGGNLGSFPEFWWFYPSQTAVAGGSTECDRYLMYNYAEGWWAWGSLARSAMFGAGAYKLPYMGGTDGSVYEHETGFLDNGASRVGKIFAETAQLGIGNSDQTADVRQMLIATGNGFNTISVQGFGRYAPEGQEYQSKVVTPNVNGYTDIRMSYRDTRIRFTNAKDGSFAIGTFKFDVTPGSGR